MLDAYNAYLKSVAIERVINSAPPSVNKYKLHKYIESYLIEVANSRAGGKTDPATVRAKLTNEAGLGQRDPGLAQKYALLAIDMPAASVSSAPAPARIGDVLVCGTHRREIPPDRFARLLARGSLEQLAAASLRAASWLPGGHWLAIPVACYQKYANAGFTIEGFASPFNSQIIMTTHNTAVSFCSLAREDAPFGSLGSFFDFDVNLPGDFVVNPPFTETLLELAARKCIALLAKPGRRVCFWGPNWLGKAATALPSQTFARAVYHDILASAPAIPLAEISAFGIPGHDARFYDSREKCFALDIAFEDANGRFSTPIAACVYYLKSAAGK